MIGCCGSVNQPCTYSPVHIMIGYQLVSSSLAMVLFFILSKCVVSARSICSSYAHGV